MLPTIAETLRVNQIDMSMLNEATLPSAAAAIKREIFVEAAQGLHEAARDLKETWKLVLANAPSLQWWKVVANLRADTQLGEAAVAMAKWALEFRPTNGTAEQGTSENLEAVRKSLGTIDLFARFLNPGDETFLDWMDSVSPSEMAHEKISAEMPKAIPAIKTLVSELRALAKSQGRKAVAAVELHLKRPEREKDLVAPPEVFGATLDLNSFDFDAFERGTFALNNDDRSDFY